MAFCETNKIWSINLVLDNNPGLAERLGFELTIDASGLITGLVKVSNGEFMSRLRGQCQPFNGTGAPLSFMSFIFRVRKNGTVRGVHMSGIAHPPLDNPRFAGKLRTFTPDINTPPSEGSGELQTITLSPDAGDTGTGTGQQT